MMSSMEQELTKKQVADLKVLVRFIEIFCSARHGAESRQELLLPPDMEHCFRKPVRLCPECAGLVAYGIGKRRVCPLDPKPSCKKCAIHCYSREYRQKIREIMAFSGRKMIMRGRLDYLWHYFI